MASLPALGARRAVISRSSARLARATPFSTSAPSLVLPSASRSAQDDAADKPAAAAKQGILKSLLHGSETARAAGPTTAQSHSKTVGRNKYIHEIQRHVVKPECVDEYKRLVAAHYPKIAGDEALPTRLTGSWEVVVGDLETFYHIWEYDSYGAYDQCSSMVQDSLNQALRPLLAHRTNWIVQEFGFWSTSPPKETGGIYELRTYHLKPGTLLEWETNWRRGLEARRRFVEPIGAYFSQIGGLHTVNHIWAYPNLDERKKTRDQAWQVETWNDTVSQTVKLIDKMHAAIMRPLDFSPLK